MISRPCASRPNSSHPLPVFPQRRRSGVAPGPSRSGERTGRSEPSGPAVRSGVRSDGEAASRGACSRLQTVASASRRGRPTRHRRRPAPADTRTYTHRHTHAATVRQLLKTERSLGWPHKSFFSIRFTLLLCQDSVSAGHWPSNHKHICKFSDIYMNL